MIVRWTMFFGGGHPTFRSSQWGAVQGRLHRLTHRLSFAGREVECCEGLITPAKVEEALPSWCGDKSPGLDSLPYELYARWPHCFETCWHVSAPTDNTMDLYPDMWAECLWWCLERCQIIDKIYNFLLIILLKAELEILTKVLKFGRGSQMESSGRRKPVPS